LANKNDIHNVKILAKNKTKDDYAVYAKTANGMENIYAYCRQRQRLQGMLLTTSGDSIMETQK
jgi:ligA (fragment)